MDTLSALLKAAKSATDANTVQAVADRLGVSRQTVYTWKRGELEIDDEHLARLIELAGADPSAAIEVRRETAKSHRQRAMWTGVAKRLGMAAAVALCVVGFGSNSPDLLAFGVLPFLPVHIMSIGAVALLALAWWAAHARRPA